MRVGVDVGDARIGVAVSDAPGIVVVPFETVPTHPLGRALKRIVSLVREREAIEVVVGLPKNMGGDEGPAAQKARNFAQRLAMMAPDVRVCLIDERLSTVNAHSRLSTAGMSSRKHRNVVDQVAAQIILERALDVEKTSGTLPGEAIAHTGNEKGSGLR
mgnify:FL=1